MLSLLQFLLQSEGQSLKAPGGTGGLAVDLCNEYLRCCFDSPHIWLQAADWAQLVIPGWSWVRNTPTNFPLPGSIVVWSPHGGHSIGAAGHVAIAVWWDRHLGLSLDQDWPAGSPCRFRGHDYLGVRGWHTPPPH